MFQDTLHKIYTPLIIKSFFFNFLDEWKAGLTRSVKFAFGVRLHHRNTAHIHYSVGNFVGITEVDFVMPAVYISNNTKL